LIDFCARAGEGMSGGVAAALPNPGGGRRPCRRPTRTGGLGSAAAPVAATTDLLPPTEHRANRAVEVPAHPTGLYRANSQRPPRSSAVQRRHRSAAAVRFRQGTRLNVRKRCLGGRLTLPSNTTSAVLVAIHGSTSRCQGLVDQPGGCLPEAQRPPLIRSRTARTSAKTKAASWPRAASRDSCSGQPQHLWHAEHSPAADSHQPTRCDNDQQGTDTTSP
jgi:hypothetical protein